MGLSGAAVFVRNEKHDTKETLIQRFCDYMETEGYIRTESTDASVTLRFQFPEHAEWIGVCEDERNPGAIKRDLRLLDGAFHVPMLSAELVDSDFVTVSLYSGGHVAGKLTIGEPYWGEKPCDYDVFAQLLPDSHTQAQLKEICEGGDVFAEDGLAALGTCLDLDITLLTDNGEAVSAVLYFTKTQVPEAERTELYSGNILSMTEKPDAAALAERMVQIMASAWEHTGTETGRYIRIMETGSSLLLFSNLLYPKQLAACAGAPLIHISVAEQDIQTAVLQPNIMAKSQCGTLPRTALPELLESAGTNEEAFREAALNGTGCTTLFFTDRIRPAERIGLTLRTLYETERFAYLFDNSDRLTTAQVIEKLDTFLEKVYGPTTISFQRLNPDSGEYEPVSYQDPGGICRTDEAHGEAYLRIFVNENGIALTGDLALPGNHQYIAALEQSCLYLSNNSEYGFSEFTLYAADGSRLRMDMVDIQKCAEYCDKYGFDPALPDAVYGSDAVVCWYSRPRDAI